MADRPKSETVAVRMTFAERDAWQKAADAEQMALSQWIRRRCNGLAAVAPQMKGGR